MIEHIYKLNITPTGKPKTIHVSQYDGNSRALKFELYNDYDTYSIPSGTTVKMTGTKPSGKGFEVTGTFEENVVTIVVTDQMTVEPGSVLCELVLTNGSKRLGTQNILLEVEKAGLSADTVISSDTFDSIIKDKVLECANEKLIELKVDTELNGSSEKMVTNEAIANNVANALTGNLSGAVIVANDVSPVKHLLKVKVNNPSNEVTLKTCGENIINSTNLSEQKAGYYSNVTLIESNNDGTNIIVKGDEGASANAHSSGWLVLNHGDYIYLNEGDQVTISADITLITEGIYGNVIKFSIMNDSGGSVSSSPNITVGEKERHSATRIVSASGLYRFMIMVNSNHIAIENIMVSLNGKETYEPYVSGNNYTPDTDGTVKNVISLSPVTTVYTNTINTTVEITYNKDINVVINDLLTKVNSLVA